MFSSPTHPAPHTTADGITFHFCGSGNLGDVPFPSQFFEYRGDRDDRRDRSRALIEYRSALEVAYNQVLDHLFSEELKCISNALNRQPPLTVAEVVGMDGEIRHRLVQGNTLQSLISVVDLKVQPNSVVRLRPGVQRSKRGDNSHNYAIDFKCFIEYFEGKRGNNVEHLSVKLALVPEGWSLAHGIASEPCSIGLKGKYIFAIPMLIDPEFTVDHLRTLAKKAKDAPEPTDQNCLIIDVRANKRLRMEARDWSVRPFDSSDAEKIIEFLEGSSATYFFIMCENGYSRTYQVWERLVNVFRDFSIADCRTLFKEKYLRLKEPASSRKVAPCRRRFNCDATQCNFQHTPIDILDKMLYQTAIDSVCWIREELIEQAVYLERKMPKGSLARDVVRRGDWMESFGRLAKSILMEGKGMDDVSAEDKVNAIFNAAKVPHLWSYAYRMGEVVVLPDAKKLWQCATFVEGIWGVEEALVNDFHVRPDEDVFIIDLRTESEREVYAKPAKVTHQEFAVEEKKNRFITNLEENRLQKKLAVEAILKQKPGTVVIIHCVDGYERTTEITQLVIDSVKGEAHCAMRARTKIEIFPIARDRINIWEDRIKSGQNPSQVVNDTSINQDYVSEIIDDQDLPAGGDKPTLIVEFKDPQAFKILSHHSRLFQELTRIFGEGLVGGIEIADSAFRLSLTDPELRTAVEEKLLEYAKTMKIRVSLGVFPIDTNYIKAQMRLNYHLKDPEQRIRTTKQALAVLRGWTETVSLESFKGCECEAFLTTLRDHGESPAFEYLFKSRTALALFGESIGIPAIATACSLLSNAKEIEFKENRHILINGSPMFKEWKNITCPKSFCTISGCPNGDKCLFTHEASAITSQPRWFEIPMFGRFLKVNLGNKELFLVFSKTPVDNYSGFELADLVDGVCAVGYKELGLQSYRSDFVHAVVNLCEVDHFSNKSTALVRTINMRMRKEETEMIVQHHIECLLQLFQQTPGGSCIVIVSEDGIAKPFKLLVSWWVSCKVSIEEAMTKFLDSRFVFLPRNSGDIVASLRMITPAECQFQVSAPGCLELTVLPANVSQPREEKPRTEVRCGAKYTAVEVGVDFSLYHRVCKYYLKLKHHFLPNPRQYQQEKSLFSYRIFESFKANVFPSILCDTNLESDVVHFQPARGGSPAFAVLQWGAEPFALTSAFCRHNSIMELRKSDLPMLREWKEFGLQFCQDHKEDLVRFGDLVPSKPIYFCFRYLPSIPHIHFHFMQECDPEGYIEIDKLLGALESLPNDFDLIDITLPYVYHGTDRALKAIRAFTGQTPFTFTT